MKLEDVQLVSTFTFPKHAPYSTAYSSTPPIARTVDYQMSGVGPVLLACIHGPDPCMHTPQSKEVTRGPPELVQHFRL